MEEETKSMVIFFIFIAGLYVCVPMLSNYLDDSGNNHKAEVSKNTPLLNDNDYKTKEEEAEEYYNENGSDFNSGCEIVDGTHSATVDYNNPETGYSNTYTLDVEVEDCQVVQIDFDSGGYLDEDHISPAEIDDYGMATVDGEDGKTYDIQIDN